jgi:protein-S-isoprenylcysteine O-methyltransferase Ste14
MQFGKVLYGGIFCILLPVILVIWADLTEKYIPVVMPSGPTLPLGLFLVAVGIGLQVLSMRQLWLIGHGLPMNAYPPDHYVTVNIYRWLRHPIYVGFVVTCYGVSLGRVD